ncbi:MAG: hypothetical protein JWM57_2999 [Phycisphaerales bacterium]|nr:hypothetical protein [Phycisphaerales bacterium]
MIRFSQKFRSRRLFPARSTSHTVAMEFIDFTRSAVVHTPGHRSCVYPRQMPDECTITYAQIAARARVTPRTIRRWVHEGLLAQPIAVAIPGSKVVLRRFPREALERAESISARRE